MKKELLFPQDCDGEQYLRRLIDAYPYDIEEARVLALLTAAPQSVSAGISDLCRDTFKISSVQQ